MERDMELAVPFATLGVRSPDDTEWKMNFARTWRSLDRLGITSWSGSTSYLSTEDYGTVVMSPTAPAYAITSSGSPATGRLEQAFVFHNTSNVPYRGALEVLLEADLAENDRLVRSMPIRIEAGKSRPVRFEVDVRDPMYQRVAWRLAAEGREQPDLRYSVPFTRRTDFLDIVPLNLQHKLVIRPSRRLYQAQLEAQGADYEKILVEVRNPSGTPIVRREVTNDAAIRVDLPKDGPWGDYRVRLAAMDAKGKPVEPYDRRFHRPPTPGWMTKRDDVMDRVLPPFTPRTTDQKEDRLTIGCHGRQYRYGGSLFPVSIRTGSVDEILAGPIVMIADGTKLPAGPVEVEKRSQVRDELVARAENDRLAATNSFWIEYDGLIYNRIELRTKQNVSRVTLRIPFKADYARYAHLTAAGFGAGGGSTRPIDRSFTSGFWPVVWLGDFERGLCWFAEGRNDLHRATAEPLSVVKDDGSTTLEVFSRAASRRARRSRSDSVCWPRRSSRCTRDICLTPMHT